MGNNLGGGVLTKERFKGAVMNKTSLIWAIVIAAVVIIGLYLFLASREEAPVAGQPAPHSIEQSQ